MNLQSLTKKKLNEKGGGGKTGDSMDKKVIILIIMLIKLFWLSGNDRLVELENAISRSMGREKVDLLLEVAKMQMEDDLEKSWESDSLALKLAKEARYKAGESRALTIAGRIELARQNYWTAIDYFNGSLELLGEEAQLEHGIIAVNIAQAYSKLGWSDKAKDKLREAEEIYKRLEPDSECVMNWQ
jgi:tetratricopeptide (TPR) repeat protein